MVGQCLIFPILHRISRFLSGFGTMRTKWVSQKAQLRVLQRFSSVLPIVQKFTTAFFGWWNRQVVKNLTILFGKNLTTFADCRSDKKLKNYIKNDKRPDYEYYGIVKNRFTSTLSPIFALYFLHNEICCIEKKQKINK